MPKKVAKKTTHIPKKTVPEVPTLKGVGEHIWDGVKDVGNGLLMLIKVILNFITWIFGGSIILILIIVLGIFLIFTAFGIKENPEWQNYINLKIGQLIKLESGIEEEENGFGFKFVL